MTLPGFTMADIPGPIKKLERLQERLHHIDAQIAELKDRKWIILSEMSDLIDELELPKGTYWGERNPNLQAKVNRP